MKKFLIVGLMCLCGFSFAKESTKEMGEKLDVFRNAHPLAEPSVVRPFASDVICIFIDEKGESDEELGAITAFLAAAFRDAACPVFVSAPLVKNLLNIDSGKIKKERLQKIEQKLEEKNYSKEEGESEEELKEEKKEIERELKKLKPYFHPDQWLCYRTKIKNKPADFFLFIPKKYQRAGYIAPKSTFVESLAKQYEYGFKLDNLIQIDKNLMGDASSYNSSKIDGDFSENFLQALKSIFVTKSEWNNLISQSGESSLPDLLNTIPRWAFFMVGHGSQFVGIDNHILEIKELAKKNKKWKYTVKWLEKFKEEHANAVYADDMQGYIAGIKSSTFKQLLLFLNKEIFTVFFFFDTCYGGGWKFDELLTEAYTYVLLVCGVAGAVVVGHGEPIDIKILEFVKKLRSYSDYNYLDIIKPIYLFLDRANRNTPNIPQIKVPGMDFTTIIDLPGEVVEIGNILAQNRSVNQPLDVSTFFGGKIKPVISGGKEKQKKMSTIYPHAIILHADKIPFPLILTAEPLEKEVEQLVFEKNQSHVKEWLETTTQQGANYLFEGGWDFDKNRFNKTARFTPKPPIFISKIPFSSWTELAEVQAPDFLLSEMIKAFLPFSSLEENRVFYVKKLIARNDFDAFGSFEQGSPERGVYYRFLAINRTVPIVGKSRTRQEGIVTKFKDDFAVETVYFEVIPKKGTQGATGKKTAAGNWDEEEKAYLPVEVRLPQAQVEAKWSELWSLAEDITKKKEELHLPELRTITKPLSSEHHMEPLVVETSVDFFAKSLYKLIEEM